ncbi:sodium/hydrogen exchanger 9B2-like isoform X4 [Agrilus planipennis]|uniref:Sodium/hydrogen exchanger 9B2-like isoform X4 n=1 Tax=Agrilus planipennis TaxID=224129 RepID=A0A1W4X7B6_AGRPL|nr:sodium/hydrogen exchanger 9B2-like isoform X4 [Agrilus planipennis]
MAHITNFEVLDKQAVPNERKPLFHMDKSDRNSFGSSLKKIICPKWHTTSNLFALVLLILLVWAISCSLFELEYVGPSSQLFKLIVLFICAKISGCIVSLFGLPPMVGMLLMGVLFRNVEYLEVIPPYTTFTSVLRFLLAAVSPAVIIPCLFKLQGLGYGVNKGIHTLVIAASTVNDLVCIVGFGIVLDVIFSSGPWYSQISKGPIVLAIGFAYGIAWGVLCYFIPSTENEYIVTLRTLLLGLGCLLSAVGSSAIGYAGAGALGCIVAAFVASIGWRRQGWDSNNPVRNNFILLWKFFEPVSFGLIGIEVNFKILELYTVLWGILSTLVPLMLRMIVSFLSTQYSNFNVKENVFIALSWIPKATVQAALGATPLTNAYIIGDANSISYANTVLIVAVMSILLTSPIGAILIMKLGPKFLQRTLPNNPQGI